MRPSSSGPRWLLGVEVVLVLGGVSLGRSAVYAILSLIDKATQGGTPLNEQTTTLNTSQTPDRPWLDLAYQLAGNLLPLVPVAWRSICWRCTSGRGCGTCAGGGGPAAGRWAST